MPNEYVQYYKTNPEYVIEIENDDRDGQTSTICLTKWILVLIGVQYDLNITTQFSLNIVE